MSMLGPSYSSNQRAFLDSVVPRVETSWLSSQTGPDGFRTTSCEKIAKIVMRELDSRPDRLVEVFSEFLTKHCLSASFDWESARLDHLLYEALASAFKSHFLGARYNGTKPEHRGLDLFTRVQATQKAHHLAWEITDRLLKEKRGTLLDRLERRVRVECLNAGVKLPADLARDRAYLTHVIRPLFNTGPASREGIMSLLQRTSTARSAIETPMFIEMNEERLQRILPACASMQVPFSEAINLGCSKERNVRDVSGVPISWAKLEHDALNLAEVISLRSITLDVLTPWFDFLRETPAEVFDDFAKLYKLIRAKQATQADTLFNEIKASPDRLRLLQELTQNLTRVLDRIPPIVVTLHECQRAGEAVESASSDSDRVRALLAYTQKLYLVSLSCINIAIGASQRYMVVFLNQSTKKLPDDAPAAPSSIHAHEEAVAHIDAPIEDDPLIQELKRVLEARKHITSQHPVIEGMGTVKEEEK